MALVQVWDPVWGGGGDGGGWGGGRRARAAPRHAPPHPTPRGAPRPALPIHTSPAAPLTMRSTLGSTRVAPPTPARAPARARAARSAPVAVARKAAAGAPAAGRRTPAPARATAAAPAKTVAAAGGALTPEVAKDLYRDMMLGREFEVRGDGGRSGAGGGWAGAPRDARPRPHERAAARRGEERAFLHLSPPARAVAVARARGGGRRTAQGRGRGVRARSGAPAASPRHRPRVAVRRWPRPSPAHPRRGALCPAIATPLEKGPHSHPAPFFTRQEMCAQMYYRGKMFGFVHLYSGQEAVSTGVIR